jgi:hypothetical protein
MPPDVAPIAPAPKTVPVPPPLISSAAFSFVTGCDVLDDELPPP